MKTSEINITIMGAGAMGSAIGGMLARHGHRVTLVGRQQHMNAIQKNGLRISGIWGEFTVNDLKTATTPTGEQQDIVLLTVKSFDTASAARQALTMVGPDTLVVSIQNGLGNIETLCEIVGKERIIAGMAIFGAIIPEPGSVKVTAIASELLVGEIDGSVTQRVQNISGILDSAGIPTKVSNNIMREIWNKVLFNVALNPLSTIFQVSYGEIADNIHTRWLVQQMITEAFQVANASGIDIGIDSPDAYLELLWNHKLPPTREHRSSMLQDIMHGKKTEIDYINGAIARLGAENGIKTPYNDAIIRMVKAKEGLGAVKS